MPDLPRLSRSSVVAGAGLVAGLAFAVVEWNDGLAHDRVVTVDHVEPVHRSDEVPQRRLLRGDRFPDGVLALTWDDGPDRETLALARYLHEMKVSATFFVVGEWIAGLSDEPGVGTTPYATGYAHLPVLGDLVALGHRIGSHTRNHALLADAATETVVEQLSRCQREIDPFVTNELRLFRAPGGAWSHATDSAMTDPFLANVIGPVHWDIDAKDWDGSLYCRSRTAAECEPSPIPGETRVRPAVMARRYLDQATATGRGIVLLHDRVGHVGSRYALDVARELIPALRERGFVFAAPLLEFGPLKVRERAATTFGDGGTPTHVADVDGDGRADECFRRPGGVWCALSDGRGLSPPTRWSAPEDSGRFEGDSGALLLGDLNGDGRTDACVPAPDGVYCALSDGHAFKRASSWSSERAAQLRLADVNGDGRADLCALGERIACGLAP
jgi:peptidoglycan/xylan/chitin deacetylase (PgdA/CDA1 family)